MVLVERLPRVRDVEVVLGLLRPGEVDKPLQVGADDAVLGSDRRQLLESRELPVRGLLGVLRETGRLDPLAQLVDLGLLLVALAELVLDRLELLAEEVLALALVDLGLDLGLDLGAELDHLQLAGEDLGEAAQSLGHIDRLEQLLLLLGRDAQRSGDQVRQGRGFVDIGHRQLELLRQVWDRLDDLGEGALDVPGERLELGGGLEHVRHRLDPRHEVRLLTDIALDPDPLGALDEDAKGAVGDLHHPGDGAGNAHPVEVVRAGRVVLGIAGGDHRQHPVAGEDVVDEIDRALLAHRERRQRVGVGDGLPQRQDRQCVGERLGAGDRVFDVGDLHDLELGGLDVGHCQLPFPVWGGYSARSIGTWRAACGTRVGSSTLRIPSS